MSSRIEIQEVTKDPWRQRCIRRHRCFRDEASLVALWYNYASTLMQFTFILPRASACFSTCKNKQYEGTCDRVVSPSSGSQDQMMDFWVKNRGRCKIWFFAILCETYVDTKEDISSGLICGVILQGWYLFISSRMMYTINWSNEGKTTCIVENWNPGSQRRSTEATVHPETTMLLGEGTRLLRWISDIVYYF